MDKKNEKKNEQKSSELEALKTQLEQALQQANEYKEMLQRVHADFENYKKRQEKMAYEIREQSVRDTIAKLLPVIDSFQIAIKNTENKDQFVQGIKLIYNQLYSTLEGMGLRKIESVGKKFDPYLHDAIIVEESEKDGIVIEELQKGYIVKDAVIRHSKVKIGKSKGDEKNEQASTAENS